MRAGAELVLSVNAPTARRRAIGAAKSSSCPTCRATLDGLDETVEYLAARGVRLRIDPVLEPIGFGFAASLGRYLEVRAPLSRCRDDDGRRQPDRADRRRFGRRQRRCCSASARNWASAAC